MAKHHINNTKALRSGRPKIQPDMDEVRAQLAAGIPLYKVAQSMGISHPTLAKRLAESPGAINQPHPGPMDTLEFLTIKRKLGLTLAQCSRLLGLNRYGANSYTRADASRIPNPTALALRLLAKYPQEAVRILNDNKHANSNE